MVMVVSAMVVVVVSVMAMVVSAMVVVVVFVMAVRVLMRQRSR
jgi:hypothetical protein